MANDGIMIIIFEILFIIVGIVGFLASVFNWEWYFGLSRKGRLLSDLIGEKNYRILNAVVCVLVAVGSFYLLIKGM